MNKRKRRVVLVLALVLTTALLFLLFSGSKSTDTTNQNVVGDDFFTEPAADGDIFEITEYGGPSIEEILKKPISNEQKAQELYLEAQYKQLTDLQELAAEYFDTALKLDDLAQDTRTDIVFERYLIARKLNQESKVNELTPQLDDELIAIAEKVFIRELNESTDDVE